jgi:hypothetical protein
MTPPLSYERCAILSDVVHHRKTTPPDVIARRGLGLSVENEAKRAGIQRWRQDCSVRTRRFIMAAAAFALLLFACGAGGSTRRLVIAFGGV